MLKVTTIHASYNVDAKLADVKEKLKAIPRTPGGVESLTMISIGDTLVVRLDSLLAIEELGV